MYRPAGLLVGVFAWSVVATGFAWFGLLCLLFLAALDRHPSPAD